MDLRQILRQGEACPEGRYLAARSRCSGCLPDMLQMASACGRKVKYGRVRLDRY